MKYKAVLPESNVNVSHEHPLREFLILLAGSAGILLILYFLMGLFVDNAVDYISPEMELAIHESAGFYGWEQDAGQFSDEEESAQELIEQLAQCGEINVPIKLRISESEDINAFAAPGGYVVVLSGLLENIESENGLAFVLAHELAHFQNRDHLRSMGRGVVLLAMSVLLGGTNSDFLGILTPIGSIETARYSQERESAADETALHILQCHYGHVGGSTEFFRAIASREEGTDYSLTHYFSSHPEARKRINAIRELNGGMGYKSGVVVEKKELKPDSVE